MGLGDGLGVNEQCGVSFWNIQIVSHGLHVLFIVPKCHHYSFDRYDLFKMLTSFQVIRIAKTSRNTCLITPPSWPVRDTSTSSPALQRGLRGHEKHTPLCRGEAGEFWHACEQFCTFIKSWAFTELVCRRLGERWSTHLSHPSSSRRLTIPDSVKHK